MLAPVKDSSYEIFKIKFCKIREIFEFIVSEKLFSKSANTFSPIFGRKINFELAFCKRKFSYNFYFS